MREQRVLNFGRRRRKKARRRGGVKERSRDALTFFFVLVLSL
jgi:hypothetical protein